MKSWWFLLLVFAMSWGLTFFLRRYALAKSLMDIPNERSSHTIPTPRGGGVAIVISFLLALPVISGLDLLSHSVLYGVFGAGLFVAIIGFADDHGHIAARWRLLGHFTAAAWGLYWLSGLPPIGFLGFTVDLGWFGNTLAVVYLVWMLNLYNFMDGINGLASIEAISACVGMCLIYWCLGHVELIWLPLILATAVAGFMYWNFPRARIFMGDAGSGFIGIVLGGMALQAAHISIELFWSWLILLGVFIVDATWTLIRRLVQGEKLYQAHRSHGYQKAAIRWGHQRVTWMVAILNIGVLLPVAALVATGVFDGMLSILVTYACLSYLAYMAKAGIK
ncbi:glycosyltransferase family 4 protein [Pseudomonas sp. SWRI153]|uniref:Glycosyltransferase family 4 protein n=1 Tax=Pseudomonas khorasanensis TaxID=2745508 RepID=A0A923JEB4_9PSED|nr:glycosyltransferase family 4 protein [Pseudomonas khorasanensis]MBV4485762.1 glycosyltransferase family 4 protein [Pseudomonas khorasanensis]